MAGDSGETFYIKSYADFKAMGLDGAALQVLREGIAAIPTSAQLLELAMKENVQPAAPVAAKQTWPAAPVAPSPVATAASAGYTAAPLPASVPSWRPPSSAAVGLSRDAGNPNVRKFREAQAAHAAFVESDASTWQEIRARCSAPGADAGSIKAVLAEEKRLRDAATSAFNTCKEDVRRFGLEFRTELLRPPCTPDLAHRVHDAYTRGGVEAALRQEVDLCEASMYAKGSTLFESEGPGSYLRVTRQLSETDAPLQRARDLATVGEGTVHALLATVAEEIATAVQALPHCTAKVLVLGGSGASAVRAVRAGAERVLVCEARRFVAAATREVLRRNLSAEEASRCTVESAQCPADAGEWDVIGVDLWDNVGGLSLGALEALRTILGDLGPGQQRPRVIPDRLSVGITLADGRLNPVSGFDLSPMDARFRGLSALPLRVGPPAGDETPAHPTAWRPAPLTETAQAFDINLSEPTTVNDVVPLQLSGLRTGHASCAVVTLTFRFGASEPAQQARLRYALWLQGGYRVEHGQQVSGVSANRGPGRIWVDWDWSNSIAPPLGFMALSEWYFEMLRCRARHDLYERALSLEIAAVRQKQESCRVLDVGSGDGILSMMALREGASAVTGVEVVTSIARTSEEVIASNRPGVASDTAPLPDSSVAPVDVWCTDVRGVSTPPAEVKFDVLVSELMDASGLGENLILLTRGAKQRLCSPGAPVIPAKLKLFAVLCEAKLPDLGGVNMDAFWPFWPLERLGPMPSLWINVDLDKGEGAFRVLTEPTEFMSLELGVADIQDIPSKVEIDFHGVAAGSANVVIWWFETQLSTVDPSVVLTNAPKCIDKRHNATCWGQAMADMPLGVPVDGAGAIAEVTMEIPFGDYQLTFRPRGTSRTPMGAVGDRESPPPNAEVYSDAYAEDMREFRKQQVESRNISTREQFIGRTAIQNADVAALGALRMCASGIVAQPYLFGVEPATALRMCMGWYAVGGEGRS